MNHVFEDLFPTPDEPLVYVSYLNGKAFAIQWTVCTPQVIDGEERLECTLMLELDPTVIGQGGTLVRQRSRFVCTPTLEPIEYTSTSAGVEMSARFGPQTVQIKMPDGTLTTVPRGGAETAIEANMTGVQAMMLWLAHRQGRIDGEATFRTFVLNALMVVPYRTTPAPDLPGSGIRLRSSHDEEIELDASGLLQSSRIPFQGIETRIERPARALPAWRHGLLPTPTYPKYKLPANARFRLEDVEIAGPVTPLGGALTIPTGEPPFPAVLFLSGSGTHDRHGIAGEIDLGSHEIVDYLSNRGLVGLRYDTRGAGGTKVGADFLEHGLREIVEDALACLRYLSRRPEVDPNRIFLIGHSQGGTVALELASKMTSELPNPLGVALLAAPGRDMAEVLRDQVKTQGTRLGHSNDQIADQVARLDELVALVRSGKPWVEEEIPDHLYGAKRMRPWLGGHLQMVTSELIRMARCPVLVCQGEKDFQVSAQRDARHLYEAGRAAGIDVELALFPNLDHCFKSVEGETSTLEQYYDQSRRVDSAFLEQLYAWLIGRTNTWQSTTKN